MWMDAFDHSSFVVVFSNNGFVSDENYVQLFIELKVTQNQRDQMLE